MKKLKKIKVCYVPDMNEIILYDANRKASWRHGDDVYMKKVDDLMDNLDSVVKLPTPAELPDVEVIGWF